MGGLVRSVDSGKTWADITPQTDPPNTWNDSPAPTATDLDYVALHGDIHNDGTFYALARWQNGSGAWRGWLLKTTDDGERWSWQALGSAAPGDYVEGQDYEFDFLANGQMGWYSVTNEVTGADDAVLQSSPEHPCGAGTYWNQSDTRPSNSDYKDIYLQYPNKLSFDDATVYYRQPSSAGITGKSGRWRVGWSSDGSSWTYSSTVSKTSTGDNSLTCQSLKVTPDSPVVEQFTRCHHSTHCFMCTPSDAQVSKIAFTNLTIHEPNEVRPLGIEVDSEDSSRVYVTAWVDDGSGGELWLLVYDSSLSLTRTYNFGTATEAEVDAKTYYVKPFSPHLPGVANFGDYIFVYGRMSGSITHIAKSTDAGVSFSDVGNAAWSSERVTVLEASQYGAPDRVWCALTGPDGWWEAVGAAWEKKSDLDGEMVSFSRAPEGLGDNHPIVAAISGQGIYYAEDTPGQGYAAWQKLTNQPPLPGDDATVVWLV